MKKPFKPNLAYDTRRPKKQSADFFYQNRGFIVIPVHKLHRLTDIEAFLTSSKTSWIKRYLDKENKGKWKYLLDQQLTSVGQDLPFESNLDEKDVKYFLKPDTFLYNVLVSWCKLNADGD